MSNAAIVYLNLADDGVITASSSIVQAPPSTVQDPHVARRWRSLGASSEFLLCDLGSSQSIDVIALFGLNMDVLGLSRVRISTVDATGVAGDAYDSTTLAGQVEDDYDCLIDVLPAPVTGRYVRIDLANTGLAYIEAGRLVVGLQNVLDINFASGWSRRFVDRARKTESRGGQIYIDHDVTYRILNLTFEHVTADQRYGFIEQIDLLNGASTDILVLTNPASATLGRDSIWGLVEEVSSVTQSFVSNPARFQKSFQIRERL